MVSTSAVRPVRKSGFMRPLVSYFRDERASLPGKLFVVLAFAYVVFPFDAIPDFAPVVGWLDDVGVLGVAMTFLARKLEQYR